MHIHIPGYLSNQPRNSLYHYVYVSLWFLHPSTNRLVVGKQDTYMLFLCLLGVGPPWKHLCISLAPHFCFLGAVFTFNLHLLGYTFFCESLSKQVCSVVCFSVTRGAKGWVGGATVKGVPPVPPRGTPAGKRAMWQRKYIWGDLETYSEFKETNPQTPELPCWFLGLWR